MDDWYKYADLGTSLTIDNIKQSEIGKALDALRDAGFEIELNVTFPPTDRLMTT